MKHLCVTLVAVIITSYLPRESGGQQCEGEGCICKGMYNLFYQYSIDISHAFDYPIRDIDGKAPGEPSNYFFYYSPCKPLVGCNSTQGEKDTAAVCQFSKPNPTVTAFNCGQQSMAEWTIHDNNTFTIYYYKGDANRQGFVRESSVMFHVNSSVPKNENTVKYLGERSHDQPYRRIVYSFNITLGGGVSDAPIGKEKKDVHIIYPQE